MKTFGKILIIIASFFTVLTVLIMSNTDVLRVRWDKVPVIKFFALGINLKPADFDASGLGLDEPITWEQIDEEPEEWEWNGKGRWFYFNPYTKNLLKEYMSKNNLGIIPSSWSIKQTITFERCLTTFKFVELDESYRKPYINPKVQKAKIIGTVTGCISIVLWIIAVKLIWKTKKHKTQGTVLNKTGDGSVS